jgi:hypothetical protein
MAELLAIDGCSHGITNEESERKWEGFNVGPYEYDPSIARREGVGYIDMERSLSYEAGKYIKAGYNTAIMGAAVKIMNNISSGSKAGLYILKTRNNYDQIYCTIWDDYSITLTLHYTSASYILVQGPPNAITVNKWHYIEFKCELDATAGRYAAYVDGELQLSGQGQTLYTGEDLDIEYMGFIGAHSGDPIYYCDIYMMGSVDFEGSVLGDSRVDTIRPTANSSPLQFSPSVTGRDNYECVNSRNASDDNYYVSGGLHTRDIYQFDDLPDIGYPVVHGLAITAAVSTLDPGGRWIKGQAGAARSLTAKPVSSLTYRFEQFIFQTNPNYVDDRPWTTGSINSTDYGIYVSN